MMDSFISYLVNANYLVKNLTSKEAVSGLHIVMGNESCDLDSMISALALAYLRYQKNPLVIPIMNIDSHEFSVHTENCYILNKLGIDPHSLIFRNDLDLDDYHKKGLLTLSMVDHHILEEKNKHLASSVVEIYDHRPRDMQSHWSDNVNITIESVGSCATLISDEILRYCDRVTNIMCRSLAVLLYSVITFDTKARNGTTLDAAVSTKLVERFSLSSNAKEVYDELWKVHIDVSQLTPVQLLIKDLKIVEGVLPIPRLPMLVSQFLKLPNAINDVKDFCILKNSKGMVLMGLGVIESVVYRDLAVLKCSKGEVLVDAIVKALEAIEELRLDHVKVDVPQMVYFNQRNIHFGRKRLLPIIKNVLDSTT